MRYSDILRASLISAMSFVIVPLFADIAPARTDGEGIMCVGNSQIRMLSEFVSVDLYRDSAFVECHFIMKNTGSDTICTVGFPEMNFQYNPSIYESGLPSMQENMEIYVDGVLLESDKLKLSESLARYEEASSQIAGGGSSNDPTYMSLVREWSDASKEIHDLSTPWYVWESAFPANRSRSVEVKYSVPAGIIRGQRDNYFRYILHTGAGWHDSIGQAVIEVRLHGIDISDLHDMSPKGFTIDEDNKVVTWLFNQLNPTESDDIYIRYFSDRKEEWRDNSPLAIPSIPTTLTPRM